MLTLAHLGSRGKAPGLAHSKTLCVLYHTSELSNGNAFRRSVCMDELSFDANGRINTVTATKNGRASVPETTGARGVAPAPAGTSSKQPIA